MNKNVELKFSFNVKELLYADKAVDENKDNPVYPSESVEKALKCFAEGTRFFCYQNMSTETPGGEISLDTQCCFEVGTGNPYLLICLLNGVEIIAGAKDVVVFKRRGENLSLVIEEEN